MFVGGGIFGKNRAIAYSCFIALSATSTIGIIQIEVNKQIFSQWGQKIGGLFSNTENSSSSSASQDAVTPALQAAGQQIANVATQYVWPFLQGSAEAFTSLRTTYWDAFGSVKNFLISLIDSAILYRIFEKLHIKLWKVTSFFFDTGKSSSFIELFKGQQKENTLKVAKFLLGLPIVGNNNFRAHRNVFNYLLLKWMEDPEKITKKFKSLSKSIEDLTHNSSGSGGSSGGNGVADSLLGGSGVYELGIPTLDQFLNIEKEWKEKTWKLFWAGEVISKIKGGTDLVGGARSWFFDWLGS